METFWPTSVVGWLTLFLSMATIVGLVYAMARLSWARQTFLERHRQADEEYQQQRIHIRSSAEIDAEEEWCRAFIAALAEERGMRPPPESINAKEIYRRTIRYLDAGSRAIPLPVRPVSAASALGVDSTDRHSH
jgi:hypothetical protein